MAAARRGSTSSYRQQPRRGAQTRRAMNVPNYGYEDGSAVRAPEWVPQEERRGRQQARRQTQPRKVQRKRNPRMLRNRARAKSIGMGYIVFLMAASILTVFLCVQFLQIRSNLATQSRRIALMQQNLSQLQTDNDAYYKKTLASVTLEDVRKAATERLGMHYPTETQTRYYTTEENSYVRQYTAVPGQ